MVRLVAYFRIFLYMVDGTKRIASVGLAQARPNYCLLHQIINSLTVIGDFKGTSNCTNVSCTETAIVKY